MIVLDTNVVSEAMKPEIHPGVHAWLNAQVPQTLYLTSITIAEMGFGIASLPAGRRQDVLARRFEGILRLFKDRILSFDTDAARAHAELAVKARRAGRGFPTPDGYIAAIAASCDFSVASRDVSAYAAAALPVINPWEH
ncbi:plasmid stabilization protein [Herbaspirillum sp. GW103]|uniref:type II toxin-antitoxin system VapC family toxin n=1 Tax=Herbaspirillum sp. GW103 TaxID=1175306 RepID=UPI00025E3E11|nr:type II toxin-antitoxin system VapC family toxin [Herbaspirillum sp. GW103]EIJ47741.1 plasmid stabilization protein [Herbaspirillum sp. GW103]